MFEIIEIGCLWALCAAWGELDKGKKYGGNYTALLLIKGSDWQGSFCVVGSRVGDDWSNARNLRNQNHHGIRLKRTLPEAKAVYGIYASRREIT